MGKNILFGVIGLVIGLAVGFFYANTLNKNAAGQPGSAQNSPADPNLQQRVPNIEVKEQTTGGGKMPDIAETLEQAEKDPKNPEIQIRAGELYFKIRNFEKAGEFYDRAGALKPENYQTVVKLGNAYFDIGQFEKAEKQYTRALEQKPDDFGVRTDLGITFVERENPDYTRAIKEFQTSLKSNPKHEITLYNLGIAFFKDGKAEEAQNTLKKLEGINPQGDLTVRLKQILQSP